MELLDKSTFPVTLTTATQHDLSNLHRTAPPSSQNIQTTRSKQSTMEDELPAVTVKCRTQVINVSEYRPYITAVRTANPLHTATYT